MLPDWLDEETRDLVIRLFRQHGATGRVAYVPALYDPTEAVFVVDSRGAGKMEQGRLVHALTDALGRKVAIATDFTVWPEPPIPLTPE